MKPEILDGLLVEYEGKVYAKISGNYTVIKGTLEPLDTEDFHKWADNREMEKHMGQQAMRLNAIAQSTTTDPWLRKMQSIACANRYRAKAPVRNKRWHEAYTTPPSELKALELASARLQHRVNYSRITQWRNWSVNQASNMRKRAARKSRT